MHCNFPFASPLWRLSDHASEQMSTEPNPKPRKGAGRPTDYDPSYCKVVIELGRKGKSLASICAKLMVPRTVIFRWAARLNT